ncbi:MAG: membrane integrity-associated transporter subunit PqiC [Gammaproteobacteria bacterium]|nr:membrane integrity-associated transporter subunit PqiC [Gammaproteobacteria bacterium]
MRFFLLLSIALLLAGCASKPVEHFTYLLRSDQARESGKIEHDSPFFLGKLTIANYLDQPGLVVATGNGRVRAARHHQWAEPLGLSLRRFLSIEISVARDKHIAPHPSSKESVGSIDISIDQLHSNESGEAILLAFWQFIWADQTYSFRFSESLPLQQDGYDALVAAQTKLLKRFAADVAKSLPVTN